MISDYVPDLQSNPEMFAFLEHYASMGFLSVLLFLFVGVILTAIIQSSAATFAIVLIMCTKGWITFDLACAVVLGSNIGTTITPLLASMSGNVAAKRTAMGHLLFNLFGILWTLAVFYPFVRLNVDITQWLGQGNPESMFSFVNNLEATDPQTYNLLVGNSLPCRASRIVAGCTNAVQRIVRPVDVPYRIQPRQRGYHDMAHRTLCENCREARAGQAQGRREEFQLKFISGGLLSASELNIAQAEKELVVYAQRVQRMIDMAEQLVHAKEKSEEFSQLYSRLEKYEEISDRMEIEIANYLNRCAEGRLSNEGKLHIAAMLNIVSESEHRRLLLRMRQDTNPQAGERRRVPRLDSRQYRHNVHICQGGDVRYAS